MNRDGVGAIGVFVGAAAVVSTRASCASAVVFTVAEAGEPIIDPIE